MAESLDESCGIRETEVIEKRAGQATRFYVFDEKNQRVSFAYFPTRTPQQDAVRFAPETCMGCHYTFDSRRFDVVAPSFESLNLKLFSEVTTRCGGTTATARPGADQGDYHDVSFVGR